MNIGEKLNMTMLCDFYELTMGNGYFENGFKDKITYFDVFFRRVPDKGGFAIAAGLEQLIRYIEDLHFTPEDIAYLRGRNLFWLNREKESSIPARFGMKTEKYIWYTPMQEAAPD